MRTHRRKRSETGKEDETESRQAEAYKRIEPCAENSQIDAYQTVQLQNAGERGTTHRSKPNISNQFETRHTKKRYLKFMCVSARKFDYSMNKKEKKRKIE